MDCGSVYIKMCEKAEEIQVGRLPHQDDIYTSKVLFNTYHTYGEGSTWLYCQQSSFSTAPQWEDFIWIPRQDQLQEMISLNLGIWDLFAKFGRWCDEWDGPAGHFTTGEQLWLVFLMREKYQKRWDSEKEEWI